MVRIDSSVVEEIARLHAEEVDASQIANRLSLRKMQVVAILAHLAMLAGPRHEAVKRSVSPIIDRQTNEVPRVDHEVPDDELSDSTPSPISKHLDELEDGFLVGDDVEFSDPLYWRPTVPNLVPNPHLMIMGESGSGKTYAIQCLLSELANGQIPSIIFDYGQGFDLSTLDPVFVRYAKPIEYRLGDEGIPINPLQLFPSDAQGPKSVASRVSDIFDAVYQLGAIQRKVLIDAILKAFQSAGIDYDNRSSWTKPIPAMTVLQEVLDELASDKGYPSYKNAVNLGARLTTFFMLTSFASGEARWSWQTAMADSEHKVHILQFRGLEGKTQRVLVEMLLWHLFAFLRGRGQGKLNLYCVLDEAHHLSFRDGGPIDHLLREARKFGIGIIFASQQPEDFSPAAYSNSASKLVFQTTDTTQRVARFLAAKCTNYDSPDQVHQTIASLQRGRALFISENRGHLVNIIDLQKRSTHWGSL
jgi:DNA phosphorothioation-dependent restriction protein DptH